MNCPFCQIEQMDDYEDICYSCGEAVTGVMDDETGTCPECGETIMVEAVTIEGLLIGSCGDMFSPEAWEATDDSYEMAFGFSVLSMVA